MRYISQRPVAAASVAATRGRHQQKKLDGMITDKEGSKRAMGAHLQHTG